MTKVTVYDLECLSNLFTYTGYDFHNDIWFQYVICPWRNDYDDLLKHLEQLQLMIGFNNEGYDYPLLHHLINHRNEYLYLNGLELSQKLYDKSQKIIDMEFSAIADKNKFIFQIDLFKVWHYNNKARVTSLKDLEVAMRMKNIEEMPIHHTHWCKQGDEDLILEYNKNDVLATYNFYQVTLGKTEYPLYKGKNKLALRLQLRKKFGIPCINYPDVKIGETLMRHLYSKETGISEYTLKNSGGTPRDKIALKDCIPHWTHFETPEFNSILNKFKDTVITNLKGEFSASLIFHGCKMDYGQGGLHSCIKPGIYSEDDYWMILDQDVGSLYPSLGITLNLYPEHLGPIFPKVYNDHIVAVRLKEKAKPKKDRDMVIMEGYKLAANGTYGKSGEASSFLYDPLYTMKTTIGGQMFISMWTEKLVKAIPEIRFLQHNTDGLTYLLPRKDYQKAIDVENEMSELTGLFIEDTLYKKFIPRDVNNYIAVYDDSTPEKNHCKLKGCFEIDKEFHKDPSMRIVPIALKEYFVNGVPIKDTILNHKDIFDFCLRLKTNSSCTPYYRHLKDRDIVDDKLDRTTRYYISNRGGILLKDFGGGRISGVNVGYSTTIFNRYEEKEIKEYDINYQFYISEAMKIKNTIDSGQLSLF